MFSNPANPRVIGQASSATFVNTIHPKFPGSTRHVAIRLGDSGPRYTLLREAICYQSPYFVAMLSNDRYKEGDEQEVTFKEEDHEGVTYRSFDILIIEFARLADMVGATGMEETLAFDIKKIIASNPDLVPVHHAYVKTPIAYIRYITEEHLHSAWDLPGGHAVRDVMSAALVDGYLRDNGGPFKDAIRDIPSLVYDVLEKTRSTVLTVKDPIMSEDSVLN
ncbi:hypothetical protein G7Y89_g10549 [Cudoniella acicularis]|uniref:BTB domain-containing protein n=1 Tax=Cudoniella acicularis TaxID=354080 RepID=A0A8H4RE34_9HELO|nr:hypothetical protein G7Y89_g10549 [Cudoniella acicularis]